MFALSPALNFLIICANKDKIMLRQIKHEYVSYEELYKAYLDCRKHKWKTRNASEFQMNLSLNLTFLYYELNTEKYKVGRSIAFIVDKPVKREVFAAYFRDRIVHHLVINRIMNAFENNMINNSFSCRKGKGTLYGVKTLERECAEITENYSKTAYVLKCDLKSFFMTISKELLYNKVIEMVKADVYPDDEENFKFICNLIKLIIFNNPQDGCIKKQKDSKWKLLPKDKSLFNIPRTHGIPIGNLTSQIFANYFLSDFDKFVYNELGFKYYGRYVDDFYILSYNKQKLLNSINKIRDELNKIGVKLHPNKVYIQDINKGVKFIGAIIKPNRTYISNRTVGNLKQFLYTFNKKYNISNITDHDIIKFISSFNSYMGFLKHYNTFNIRRKVIRNIIVSHMGNFIYSDGNFSKIIKKREALNLSFKFLINTIITYVAQR